MTVEGSGDPSLCRRAALRHLRIVSVIYLVALITGTHWPRLELSGPSGDFDKLIHFFAFGLMIFCFWICNWVTRFISLLVVGLLICFVIEITQVTLSVGRVYSVHDIEAGAFGVVAFAVMIRALRPPADPNALRVRALWERIALSLISRPSACLVILTSGSFGVLLGGLLAIAIDFMILRSRGIEGSNAMPALMLGGLAFGIPAMLLAFRSGFRFETKRLGRVEELACLEGWFRSTLVSCLVPALLSLAAMLILLVVVHVFLWDGLASLALLQPFVFEDQGTILCLIAAISIALYLRLLMRNLARRT